MQDAQFLAASLGLKPAQVQQTIDLFDAGNTLPFVARYRKEVTGGLDEEQLRSIERGLQKLRALADRRTTILAALEEQAVLTDALREKIASASSVTELEDLYAPFKQKRRTRATMARERGLEPLAEQMVEQSQGQVDVEQVARQFLNADVADVEAALAGARDIVAEMISTDPDVRRLTRERAQRWSSFSSSKVTDAVDERQTYANYYDFGNRVERLQPHQILALNRGEREGVLNVQLAIPERDWRSAITTVYSPDNRSVWADQLRTAIDDAAQRLLLPAVERDVRRMLTEHAEEQAIRVFAANVRSVLNQPPLKTQVVLGIDPGFRTGCKVAVVDGTGAVLYTTTIYPHPPQEDQVTSLRVLETLVQRHKVEVIAIGNGTASRETEQLVAQLLKKVPAVQYVIVNEAGASVYSASTLARNELPDLDVTLRGAVSIARRVLDPLAELVKIDPQSLGVGMYQHDVNQRDLTQAVNAVVESVVNNVGVDVNTASPALLEHVAGIGPKLAQSIVKHRDQYGPFVSRTDLKKVKGLGAKAFEQSAGFLRIRDGKQLLDSSAIHPESYALAKEVLNRARVTNRTSGKHRPVLVQEFRDSHDLEVLALELDTGLPTLLDVVEQLIRPGRDPRDELPGPVLRSDVLKMEDLLPGMLLTGTVRNVVDFGAFIDIGVKQDGLLHVSKIPGDARLHAGDVLEVSIESVDIERGRISLRWSN